MDIAAQRKMAEESLTHDEKSALIRKSRSRAERNYQLALQKKIKLMPGAGKGLEPKPWCVCHSRMPCPLDSELNRYLELNA